MTREEFYQGNWAALLEKAYQSGQQSKYRLVSPFSSGNGTAEVVDAIEKVLMNATTTSDLIGKESP